MEVGGNMNEEKQTLLKIGSIYADNVEKIEKILKAMESPHFNAMLTDEDGTEAWLSDFGSGEDFDAVMVLIRNILENDKYRAEQRLRDVTEKLREL